VNDLSCWDFCFIDDFDNKLITHAFDMPEAITLANLGNRIQMYSYHQNGTYYVINWDNISFITEQICCDSSCPVYLYRMAKIEVEATKLKEASDRNHERLIVKEQERKKVKDDQRNSKDS
jgi:hypothetical protein